jgi:anti-anti-sigma factor
MSGRDRPRVLSVAGELAYESVASVAHQVAVCLSRTPLLVLDCHRVTFLDAAGMGLLAEADLWSRARGGRLAVAGLPPFAVRVLTLVRLHDRLELFDEVNAAVEALVDGQAGPEDGLPCDEVITS